MTYKIMTAMAVVAAMAVPMAAQAADMPMKAPLYKAPPAPAVSWTGCYLDAGGGYGLYDLRTRLIPTVGTPGVQLDQGGRGWLGRFGAGCDVQLGGSWVIGAFGDYDLSSIRGQHTGESFAVIGLDAGRMKLRNSWAAGGRIGYLVTPELLTYVNAGYTQARFGGTTYLTSLGIADGFAVGPQTYNGFFVGGGTEYALHLSWLPIRGLFWRSEYRFSEYDSHNLGVFATATGAPNGFVEHTKPYVQTITSSIVWRFNWSSPVVARY